MKIRANAKINLSLNICGRRDDGYHLIDTVMHSVDLYDEIEVVAADCITVECDKYAVNQEDNIAFRAAKQFFADFGLSYGAQIIIKKNIPSPAGLGGGSADAAAVLLALRSLYCPSITDKQLEKTALKLGADVPFFISGGCKRAEGIGEILTNLTPLKSGYIVLALAEQKPSTAEMYRIVDSEPYDFCNSDDVIKAVEADDLCGLAHSVSNAFSIVWKNSFVKEKLESQSPLAVSLSGSGPTWFALFEDYESAQLACENLKSDKIQAFLVTPQEKAIIFE